MVAPGGVLFVQTATLGAARFETVVCCVRLSGPLLEAARYVNLNMRRKERESFPCFCLGICFGKKCEESDVYHDGDFGKKWAERSDGDHLCDFEKKSQGR
jgi:hypothetical protein